MVALAIVAGSPGSSAWIAIKTRARDRRSAETALAAAAWRAAYDLVAQSPSGEGRAMVEIPAEADILCPAEEILDVIIDLRGQDRWLTPSSAFHGSTEIRIRFRLVVLLATQLVQQLEVAVPVFRDVGQ